MSLAYPPLYVARTYGLGIRVSSLKSHGQFKVELESDLNHSIVLQPKMKLPMLPNLFNHVRKAETLMPKPAWSEPATKAKPPRRKRMRPKA